VAPLATVVVRHSPAVLPGAGVHQIAARGPDAGREAPAETHPDRASAIEAGIAAIRLMDPPPEGIAVLDERDLPFPAYVERCGHVLAHCPEVGLVSFWEEAGGRLEARPCPARPYQWAWNDAAPASVLRLAALDPLDRVPVSEERSYEGWLLANAVVARGWVGVTVPEVLAARAEARDRVDRLDSSRMVRAVLEPFATEVSRDAAELLVLTRSGNAGALRGRRFRPREFSELALRLSSDWRQAMRWGWRRVLRRLRS
jgi:hypothetical protein